MAKARSPIIESTIGVMPGLIKQCEIVYDGINDVLSALKPYKADTYRLKSKLKWLQEKSRVIALRGYLEPLKSSLSLLLILLKNEIADKKQEPDNIRYSFEFLCPLTEVSLRSILATNIQLGKYYKKN
jgi:hypothetical protein